jgi:predicted component of type VI protein secretion system
MDIVGSPPKLKSALRGSSSVDTSTTSPVSTLSPADSASAQDVILKRMREDPAYAKAMMARFSFSPPAEPAAASGLSKPVTSDTEPKSPPRAEGGEE